MKYYWYISNNKLNQFDQQLSPSVFSNLALKLKIISPWAEAEISNDVNKENVQKNINRIEKKIKKKYSLPSFDLIDVNMSPVFFEFEGYGCKHYEEDVFITISNSQTKGLILAGSINNALGGNEVETTKLSASLSPVSRIKDLFLASNHDLIEELNMEETMSYIWQEIYRQNESQHKPKIKGIGVYVAQFAANKAQLRRCGMSEIKSIIIGTPIYIHQIE